MKLQRSAETFLSSIHANSRVHTRLLSVAAVFDYVPGSVFHVMNVFGLFERMNDESISTACAPSFSLFRHLFGD